MSEAILRVEHLSKSFGKREILRDIDFSVHPGDVTSIIGASGSGKSTLLRCINLLELPTSGRILYHNEDMTSGRGNVAAYRAKVGMVFQSFNLFNNMTVLENCTVGQIHVLKKKKEAARETAMRYLDRVGMAPYANARPQQISGGQKQRVAIARALATNPKVLLCDEATSALDPTTTASILTLLKDINQRMGITIVVITHEMSVVEEICSRVAIINESRIAELGRIEEIFASPKSDAAKRLVFHDSKSVEHFTGRRCIRIIFDGRSSFEPVVSNMVMECKVPVNILFANLKDMDGKAVGQLVLQLPDEASGAAKVKNYLTGRGLRVEEVNGYV